MILDYIMLIYDYIPLILSPCKILNVSLCMYFSVYFGVNVLLYVRILLSLSRGNNLGFASRLDYMSV